MTRRRCHQQQQSVPRRGQSDIRALNTAPPGTAMATAAPITLTVTARTARHIRAHALACHLDWRRFGSDLPAPAPALHYEPAFLRCSRPSVIHARFVRVNRCTWRRGDRERERERAGQALSDRPDVYHRAQDTVTSAGRPQSVHPEKVANRGRTALALALAPARSITVAALCRLIVTLTTRPFATAPSLPSDRLGCCGIGIALSTLLYPSHLCPIQFKVRD